MIDTLAVQRDALIYTPRTEMDTDGTLNAISASWVKV